MSTERLLSELRLLDIHVSVEGDRLRCSAPPGRLTKELEKSLYEHKSELIEALRSSWKSPAISSRTIPGTPQPLSFAQERFWFAQNLDPETRAYNITATCHVEVPVDAGALEHALHTLVGRHEILRTRLVEVDGVPAQEVLENPFSRIESYDFAGLAGEEHANAVRSSIKEFGARPFDFASGKLFRVALLLHPLHRSTIVVSAHHIICDGWSLGVFFRELRALYESSLFDHPEELPALPIQYSDYAVWERARLSPAVLAPQIEFWKSKLEGAPPSSTFPLDHPRRAAGDYQANHCAFQFDVATTESLKRLARDNAATPFMVLLSVYKALLSRYASQDTVVVGTPVSTRTMSMLEGLIGCFINTHLLRTDLSQEMTARELVNRVRIATIESLTHADVPFEVLVRELLPKRDRSFPRSFEHAFILLNTPMAQDYEVVSGGTALDMTLYMWEADGKFHGSLEYDGALFDRATITCFAACLENLALAMASQPDTPLGQLALVTPEQSDQWFSPCDGLSVDLPAQCVHEWIEKQANSSPDKLAIITEKERLSFRELLNRSSRLARRLQTLGMKPGDLVALCVNRTAEMVVAPLAIWQAGGAYVPLDPDFPPARLGAMLENADTRLLITESGLLKRLPAKLPRVICLDKESLTGTHEGSALAAHVNADDLAYVMYTSGSGGTPKGVEIRHRSLVNLLASVQREPGIRPQDRLLAVTTLSFDISALELFLPMVSGAQVIIAPSTTVTDGMALAQMLHEFDITIMQATPITWRLLLESGWKGKPGLKILCGGEALPRDLAEQLIATGGELWNLYGPTETTVWSTVERVTSPVERISIGRPVANTQICVLDERGEPIPPGVAGELFIGGVGVARGYRGRDTLTAERFVARPNVHSGRRMYQTGDLVRRLSDGRLEYLARLDQQVKIRGMRMELGEIEAALERHPAVAQAIVTVRENERGEKRLVAHCKPRNGASLDPADLRKSLRAQLPDAMIPREFVKMASLPQTLNRKVDRKALSGDKLPQSLALIADDAPEDNRQSTDESGNAYCAPGDHVEAKLEEIWCEVLEMERIGVHDNFFELGGHSLLATRVVSRIRTALEMDLPLKSIFADPTISGLASHISFEPSTRQYRYASDVPTWKRLVPVQPRGSATPLFFLAGYHQPDGPLIFLSHLIPHLAKGQPVFGFRPRWMDEHGADYVSVEEIARDYLSELRQVQPKGPYLLGGNCVEGMAVLEIARLLAKEGEEVKLIVLLDTELPSRRRIREKDIAYYRSRLGHIGEVLAGLVHLPHGPRVQVIKELAARKLGIADSAEVRANDRFHQRRSRYWRLLHRHIPKAWNGRITVIGNKTDLDRDHDLGWTGFSKPGVEIHAVPGTHETMMTEHGREVSQVIRRAIDEVFDDQASSEVKVQ